MNSVSGLMTAAALAAVTLLVGMWLAEESRAIAQTRSTPIAGAWTLNKDLSDTPPARLLDEGNRGDRDRGRQGGGGFGRGGFGRGGFGRGGGFGGGGERMNPEDMARVREAMREILNPPDHLTIAQTDTMVIITAPDGRTTRLSPDGKKVKDESTKIERKTRWDGGTLVSEINGLGPNKIIETYSVDAERHQLRIRTEIDNPRRPLTVNRIYDADGR